MIRKAQECTIEKRENMRGGDGVVEITNFASAAELNDKGRLFGKITLNPGCGIGYHVHEKDSELFYILSGTAEYDDNGTSTVITAGDITFCPAGTGHSIKNNGDEVVEMIALIVYA